MNIVESISVQDLAKRLGRHPVSILKDLKRHHFRIHMAPSCTGQWLASLTREEADRYLEMRRHRSRPKEDGSSQADLN